MKVIKFSASWCSPCKVYSPIFNKVKENNPDIDMEEIDLDNDEDIFKTYNVVNVPTTIFLSKNNEIFHRKAGIIQEKELQELINMMKGV